MSNRDTRVTNGSTQNGLRSPTTGMALQLPGLELSHPMLEMNESVPRSWRSPPTADPKHHVFLPTPPLPPHRRGWSLVDSGISPARRISHSVGSDTRDTPPTGVSNHRKVSPRTRSLSPSGQNYKSLPKKTRSSSPDERLSPPTWDVDGHLTRITSPRVSVTTTLASGRRSQSPKISTRAISPVTTTRGRSVSPSSSVRVSSRPKYVSGHAEPITPPSQSRNIVNRKSTPQAYEIKRKEREGLIQTHSPPPTRQSNQIKTIPRKTTRTPERSKRDWNILAKEREPPRKPRERSPVLNQTKRWDRFDKNEGSPLDGSPSPLKRVRSRSPDNNWPLDGRLGSRSRSVSPNDVYSEVPDRSINIVYNSPPQSVYKRALSPHSSQYSQVEKVVHSPQQNISSTTTTLNDTITSLSHQLKQTDEAKSLMTENMNRLVEENSILKAESTDYNQLLQQCKNRIDELTTEVELSSTRNPQPQQNGAATLWQESLEEKGRVLQDWDTRLASHEKQLEARDNLITRREQNLKTLQQRESDLLLREQGLAEKEAEVSSKEEELSELETGLDERTRKMALEWKELQQLRSLIEHNPVIQHEELSEKREEFQRSMQEREDRLHSRVLQLTAWEKRLSGGMRIDTPVSLQNSSPTLQERARSRFIEENRKKVW